MFQALRAFNSVTEERFTLQNESIDKITATVRQYAASLQMPQRDILSLRLTVEECLLNWQSALGENTELILRYGCRLGRPRVILSAAGVGKLDTDTLRS